MDLPERGNPGEHAIMILGLKRGAQDSISSSRRRPHGYEGIADGDRQMRESFVCDFPCLQLRARFMSPDLHLSFISTSLSKQEKKA